MHQWRKDDTGADCVYSNVVGSQLHRCCFRQAHYSGFRGRVGLRSSAATHTRYGRRIDYGSTLTLVNHDSSGMFGSQKD